MLPTPLNADMQHIPVLHLHFHLLLFYPREVRLEDVGLRGLLLVDASVGDGGGFTGGGRNVGQSAEPLKWVPNVQREKVEDVASLSAKETKSH
ncbi:hypothetical protein C1H46_010344 [Malus baccata]|uniref:Uncharacterized protein n=1 Tax=Malus baccata TaxID=106549 RepID=A0A540N0D1_MALBA|nr:hypothetical protein C1H46_010344 [Malus baccata]